MDGERDHQVYVVRERESTKTHLLPASYAVCPDATEDGLVQAAAEGGAEGGAWTRGNSARKLVRHHKARQGQQDSRQPS